MKIFLQLRAWYERLRAPNYSCCFKCRRPWKFVKQHATNYTDSFGCFPLCQNCWKELTIQERLPFYRQLWISWGADRSNVEWIDIKKAVLAGK